jgi:signal transduction histidine kinase/DNA-binding response OmpR family regulator
VYSRARDSKSEPARPLLARKELIPLLGLLAALLASLALDSYVRTAHALRGPFRIGYFRSGREHFRGADNQPHGAIVDLLNAAARRGGMKLDWVYSPEDIDIALKSGHVDLWPNVGEIPERHGTVYVTEGWNMIRYELLSRTDRQIREPEAGELLLARGMLRIDIQFSQRIFPKARFLDPPEASGRNSESPELFEAVCTKQVDAAIISGYLPLSSRPSGCAGVPLRITELPNSTIMFGIGASYRNPWAIPAADMLRRELSRMAKDGSLNELTFQWGFRSPTEINSVFYMMDAQTSSRRLAYATAIAGAAFVLLLWVALRLRAARHEAERSRLAAEGARRVAESASRAKSEFLSNMSHEIRTPLNGVMGMTELAMNTPLTDEQRDFLCTAYSSAQGLLSTINDILDFSKIEAGKMEIESAPVDLRLTAECCANIFSLIAHRKGIELAVEIAPDCPPAFQGDSARVRQVLTNILGNAVKFTEQGEVTLSVCVARQDGQPALEFSVRDTGIGVPEDKRSAIFAAFAQADASTTRRYGGTGLGLAICSRLAALMGGSIRMESKLGKGTTFFFTVPLIPAKLPDAAALSPDGEQLAGARVLVVDDNQTNRRILKQILTGWNMRADTVANGQEALDTLARAASEQAPYSLALIDYAMPEMDGFELVRRIRARADFSNPLILMLTSDDCHVTIPRCQAMGIGAYLIKPVKQLALREAIRTLIRTWPSGHPTGGAAPDLPFPVRPVPRKDESGGFRRLRVLLVEDNPVNQKVALSLLHRLGHTVTLAADGFDALTQFRRRFFDLVLMDIQMPGMDGYETTAAIRAVESARGSHTPIIALTAHAMKGDEERCRAAGMDGHLAKPIKTADLNQVLASAAEALSQPAQSS